MVGELTAEIKDYIASNKAKVDPNANGQRNEASRSGIRDELTPEHREVVDDQQPSAQHHPNLTQLEDMANMARELSDVETLESSTPSVHSTDQLIESSTGSNEELSTPATLKGRIFGSSAIPMGKYVPGQHPMTGLDNPEPERGLGDAHASCSGSGVWCWFRRLWKVLSCGLGGAEKYGRVGSIGS